MEDFLKGPDYFLSLDLFEKLQEKRKEEKESWQAMSIEEHMAYYEKEGMDRKSAMKQVAKDRGMAKREIYQYLLNK